MQTNKVLGFAAALALIVAIGSAGIVLAQTTRNAMGGGRGFRALNYLAQQLNLTDEQKQQVKSIVRSHKDDIKALLDQGLAARKALRQAEATGNSGQISAAVNQLAGVELKAAQLKAQVRAKVFSDVLQPDQRTKADQLLAQFEQRADRRRQRIERFLDQM